MKDIIKVNEPICLIHLMAKNEKIIREKFAY